MNKNVSAIDKIISNLSLRDYKAKWDTLTEKQKESYRIGKKYGQFQYTLGRDTMTAIETKRDYLADKITEEEYKAFCLEYNIYGIIY